MTLVFLLSFTLAEVYSNLLVLSCGNEINFLAVGHGGSDGLHGYVPSLDHVVLDTVSS